MKTKRKYTMDQQFVGTVGAKSIMAGGRTKREAEKRLRRMFASELPPTLHGSIGTLEVRPFERPKADGANKPKPARVPRGK